MAKVTNSRCWVEWPRGHEQKGYALQLNYTISVQTDGTFSTTLSGEDVAKMKALGVTLQRNRVNREQFQAANAELHKELKSVMRKIKFLEDLYLDSALDAYKVNAIVEMIDGPSSKKPRRYTMRIVGRTVEGGEPWYQLTSDITGKGEGRHVSRFVPHKELVGVIVPHLDPLPT